MVLKLFLIQLQNMNEAECYKTIILNMTTFNVCLVKVGFVVDLLIMP